MVSIYQRSAQAVVPVLATSAAIATLSASGLSFPAALELAAWPQWVLLGALVFTYSTFGYWGAQKAQQQTQPPSPSVAREP